MTKRMLGMIVVSMLSIAACGEPGDEELDEQGDDALESRFGRAGRRGNGCDGDQRGGGNGGSASGARGDASCDDRNGRDGGARAGDGGTRTGGGGDRRDAGPRAGGGDNRRDAGTRAGGDDSRRDAGRASGGRDNDRDAGTTTTPPRDTGSSGGGPAIVGADRDVITLPDGKTVQLDRSCPALATPFGVSLPGCCLPPGTCGLSTHDVDVAGVPKGCFGYDQAKMLDPNFNLPTKSCTMR